MDPKNFEDVYSVSPGQSAILSQEAPGPESGIYCRQLRCGLLGGLDVAAFARAWQSALERHTVLRTSFLWKRLDSPLQVVHREVQFPLGSYDWRDLPPDRVKERLDNLLDEELLKGVDPLRAPLVRAALCRVGDEAYHLVGTFHSLALDNRSLYFLLREALACYRNLCEGRESEPEAGYPYWNYIDWLNRQDLDGAEQFWTESLKGVSTPTPLAISRAASHPAGRDTIYLEERMGLSPELAGSLRALSKERGLGFGTLIQGAWALLLGRHSGEEDVIFGLAVSGRPKGLDGAESMPGPLDNTLPVRVRIPREARVSSWLETLEKRLTDVRSYDFSPLDQVRGWSDIPRELPLFESVVVSDAHPDAASLGGPWAGVEIGDVSIFPRDKAPLALKVLDAPEPALSITYERDRFDAGSVRRMLGHLRVILGGIASSPDCDVDSLPLLTDEELKLLTATNRAATEYRFNIETIHRAVELQREKMPARIAVTFEDEEVTYAELNRRANQLAHHLRRLGVGLEDRVGICVERSAEMIVGILGILKAGAAYVPLDPAYPKQRLEFMLDDTAASVVLTQRHLKDSLPERSVSVLCLDSDWPLIARCEEHDPDAGAGLDNAAYVIYTSGSTGNPKGVVVTHRNVGRLFEGTREWFDFDRNDIWTLFHSYAFDFSVWEIWGALMHGGRLVVVPYLVSRSPEAFFDLLVDQKVTVLNQTPSAFRQLIHADERSDRSHGLDLRRVIFGGEALELQSLRPWMQRHGHERIELINMYGITETTVHVTYRGITEEDLSESTGSVIGGPIPDLQVYILDKRMRPVPIGIDGEMYVGGEGLARGYLNRPDLTPERFIPDAYGSKEGGRLYKTGDLARYRPDGDIEFIGRSDLQVKLRGFRVELGEIEAVLRDIPQVMEAVVVAHEGHTENARLVAYIFGNGESLPGAGELKDAARRKLPDYMVPTDYVILQDIPLTPNGKIDRRALPSPGRTSVDSKDISTDILLPRDTVELQLTQIWEEVLGVQPVGLENSFFDLGGHSLLAVRLMIKIEEAFGEKLPVASLFQEPTVEGLARLIRQRGSGTYRSSLVKIQPRGREHPFFCVHPSGGNVFCYTALARCLGPDQPFYGLQARGLDGAEPVHTRIEEMAAHYIEALREVQPSGPYLLGGWSMGGVVAFEMARQIEERGESVDLLVLMDARNPLLDRDLQEEKEDLAQLESFAVQLGVPPDYLRAGREMISKCDPEARLSIVLEQAKLAGVLRSDLDISQMRRLFDVFSSNIRALRSYVPRARRGRVVLLKAARSKRNKDWDSSLGWDELTTEGAEVHEVPGNHFGMMRSPNVRHLAEQLAACIRKASPVAAAV